VKPTIGENMLRTIEVHIIEFSADLYGQVITVELVRRLRGELQFANVQALKLQIGVDVERVKRGV
jgi:riboflavin kinase/FMN adenylyltransferase